MSTRRRLRYSTFMSNRYFIGLALPPELSEPLTGLKQQLHYKTEHSLSPLVPHITLLHPSSLDTSPPEVLLPQIKEIAAPYLPLLLRLDSVETFDHEVLYIKVYSPELEELQSKLVELLPTSMQVDYHKRPYTPHSTLLQVRRPYTLDSEILRQRVAHEITLPANFTAGSLSYFTQTRPREYVARPLV